MDINQSVWDMYQPGYVDPMYVPYLRYEIRDPWNNKVNINKWEYQTLGPNGGPSGMVDPILLRKNWGSDFMNMFQDDPCPYPYEKTEGGRCVRKVDYHEPVFYTDKSFIPQYQHFQAYSTCPVPDRRISEQTDLRSVSPLTGQYVVYFKPVNSSYGDTKYGQVCTKDSYLA